MRLLELFCGTKSVSKQFNKHGFKTYSIDIMKKFEPSFYYKINHFLFSLIFIILNNIFYYI